MKNKSVKIRVAPDFKRRLKQEAAQMDMSMLKLSKKLSKIEWDLQNEKNKKKRYFEI